MKYPLDNEVLVERFVRRVENANTRILKDIGKVVNAIKNLTPSEARRLEIMIKYGSTYDTIIERLAKVTNMNVNEIDYIMQEYAKKDHNFAKKFYDYKNIKQLPFEEMPELKAQINAVSLMTKQTYQNLSNTSVIGFTLKINDKVQFMNISDAYKYVIDESILSIAQGKETFDDRMYDILRSLGKGIKTVDYESGYTRRMDSAIRMNLRAGIRDLHNKTEEVLGRDFGADGVEISVHEYPAIDHEDLQGRQFSYKEYDKLQNGKTAKDYKGIKYYHIKDKKERRPISAYNCYHSVFAIVLGASEPLYTNDELEEIKERNDKGFVFEGKKYTMYKGTQLQRRLETAIRQEKDTQILGVEAGNKELVEKSQQRITQLTNKYRELCKVSGLEPFMERMRVATYKRKDISKMQ